MTALSGSFGPVGPPGPAAAGPPPPTAVSRRAVVGFTVLAGVLLLLAVVT